MKSIKLRLSALSMLTAAALAFSPMIPQAVPDAPAASTVSSFQSQDEAITPAQSRACCRMVEHHCRTVSGQVACAVV